MLCQGSATGIMWPDQWTISTVDGGRSAQFEHTVSNCCFKLDVCLNLFVF